MPALRQKTNIQTLKEETWATLDRIAKSHEEFREDLKKSREEFDLRMKKSSEKSRRDSEKRSEEFDKKLKKSSKKFDKSLEEVNKTLVELGTKLASIGEIVGSAGHNVGHFAEEYFQDSFDKGKRNFFGKRFNKLERNMQGRNPKFQDEYDIVLINGKCVCIIEVKFKGNENDISKVLKKVNTFRENFPFYANHKIYLD